MNLDDALATIARLRVEGVDGKGACIPASLGCRDFLRAQGFEAEVRSCAVLLKATQGEDETTLLAGGKGLIGQPVGPDEFDGHLICVVKGLIVDPTLGQLRRPAWPWLPDVVAVKKLREFATCQFPLGHKLRALAAYEARHESTSIGVVWFATSNRKWVGRPIAQPQARQHIVRALQDAMNGSPSTPDRNMRHSAFTAICGKGIPTGVGREG